MVEIIDFIPIFYSSIILSFTIYYLGTTVVTQASSFAAFGAKNFAAHDFK
jgi:hypothetical protein